MTAFLHYFFLATFTWTLCEAVLIYILLVKVFGANDKKWIYLYLALGWGKPIPTVLTSPPAWAGNCRPHLYLLDRIVVHYSVCFVRYKWGTHLYLENAVASFSL